MNVRHSLLKCTLTLVLTGGAVLVGWTTALAQPGCAAPVLTAGLQRPQGLTRSGLGNLIVSESGTLLSNSGRISIVTPAGERRVLLEGVPSGISDVGDPSGPSGMFMRDRTLYVAIGIGDSILAGPIPRTAVANPAPSSPIFSSILAIHFGANVEKTTSGFTLSSADQEKLAAGGRVKLSNGVDEQITVTLVANFPDYIAEPRPDAPSNVRGSNPFDLVRLGGHLYVTDGGRNLVWQVHPRSGAFSALATFPNIPNPFPVGPPVVEAVPTGIVRSGGQLLVTLFRGVPFPPGTSVVERIDPVTGAHEPFISGLKTAIDVIPTRTGNRAEFLVLQHSSGELPFFTGPGIVLRFDEPAGPGTVVAGCLERPTSMTLDRKTRTLYVTELLTGRILEIQGWD